MSSYHNININILYKSYLNMLYHITSISYCIICCSSSHICKNPKNCIRFSPFSPGRFVTVGPFMSSSHSASWGLKSLGNTWASDSGGWSFRVSPIPGCWSASHHPWSQKNPRGENRKWCPFCFCYTIHLTNSWWIGKPIGFFSYKWTISYSARIFLSKWSLNLYKYSIIQNQNCIY